MERDSSAIVHVALFNGKPTEGEVAALFKGVCVSQAVQFWLGNWSWQGDTCGQAVGKPAEVGVMHALRERRRAALQRVNNIQGRLGLTCKRTSEPAK